MILQLFEDKPIFYNTDNNSLRCFYYNCKDCPILNGQYDNVVCNMRARERVIDLLVSNIKELINLC